MRTCASAVCAGAGSYAFIPAVVFGNALLDIPCYLVFIPLWRLTSVPDRSGTGGGFGRLLGVRNINPGLYHQPSEALHQKLKDAARAARHSALQPPPPTPPPIRVAVLQVQRALCSHTAPTHVCVCGLRHLKTAARGVGGGDKLPPSAPVWVL